MQSTDDSKEKLQGFASFSTEKLKDVSSRGGKAKVPKGFSKMSDERRKEVAQIAAKARWEKRRERELKERNEGSDSGGQQVLPGETEQSDGL